MPSRSADVLPPRGDSRWSTGATTLWERWDGWTPEKGFREGVGNSFNHYAFGSVGDWLYRYVGGLEPDPDHTGYAHATIHPRRGGTLRSAGLAYESVRGRWEVRWELVDGDLTVEVTVPPNASADVILPGGASAIRDEDRGGPVGGSTSPAGPDATALRVGSGRYRLRALGSS